LLGVVQTTLHFSKSAGAEDSAAKTVATEKNREQTHAVNFPSFMSSPHKKCWCILEPSNAIG
jgi:hypothetical protein